MMAKIELDLTSYLKEYPDRLNAFDYFSDLAFQVEVLFLNKELTIEQKNILLSVLNSSISAIKLINLANLELLDDEAAKMINASIISSFIAGVKYGEYFELKRILLVEEIEAIKKERSEIQGKMTPHNLIRNACKDIVNDISRHYWSKDSEKQIRISEMYYIIKHKYKNTKLMKYSEKTIKQWLRESAHELGLDYVSASGAASVERMNYIKKIMTE